MSDDVFEDGLLAAQAGDENAFATRVVAVARSTDQRARAATCGRRLFETEFTWEAIARRLLAVVCS